MTVEAKWCWKMDYCKKQGIPPAQTWAWEQAEKAFCMTHNPKLTGAKRPVRNEMTNEVERVVIRLEELRPHMTIVWAFNRFHVADAMAKMLGGKRASYDSAASRILAKARKDGTLKPARKDYDRYYFFADV